SADVKQRRLDLVLDLQVDVLKAHDVAEILGAAIVLLAHVSLPPRDPASFGNSGNSRSPPRLFILTAPPAGGPISRKMRLASARHSGPIRHNIAQSGQAVKGSFARITIGSVAKTCGTAGQ